MFERELDYFGVAIEEDSITVLTGGRKGKTGCILLAMESHRQFHLKQSGSDGTVVEIRIGTQDDLYKQLYSLQGSGKDIFDKYLGNSFVWKAKTITIIPQTSLRALQLNSAHWSPPLPPPPGEFLGVSVKPVYVTKPPVISAVPGIGVGFVTTAPMLSGYLPSCKL